MGGTGVAGVGGRERGRAGFPHRAHPTDARGTRKIEKKGGATIDGVRHLVAGARGRAVYEEGEPDVGIWSAGMIQGLIHDIPTCAVLVARIVADAELIIATRLARMMSA